MKRIVIALLGLLALPLVAQQGQPAKPRIAGMEPAGTGDWQAADSRTRRELRPLPYGLREILQLRPRAFVEYPAWWEPNGTLRLGTNGTSSIGLLGEEVKEVIPEAARRPLAPEFNFWQVDYTKLVPVLVRAIQEQQEQLRARTEEVEALRRELAELQRQLDDLRQQRMRHSDGHRYAEPTPGINTADALLGQNIPNPHDGTTAIPCYVPSGVSRAELVITDASGRIVRIIGVSTRDAWTSVTLDMNDFATGSYEYRLLLDGRVVASRIMQLVR
jgi:hypothetical protein